MVKKWLAVLIVGILAIATALYVLFYRVVPPEGDPFIAVPADAGMIFSWESPVTTIAALQSDSLGQQLQVYALPHQLIQEWSFLLGCLPEDFHQAIGHTLASVHKVSATRYGLLFVVSSDKRFKPDDLLPGIGAFKQRQFKGVTIYEQKTADHTISVAAIRGLVLASSTPFLVEAAIEQTNQGAPAFENADFRQAVTQASRNNRPKVFFNVKQLAPLLSTIVETDQVRLSALSGYAGWAVLEYALVPDGIFLNGYLLTADAPTGMPALLLETDQKGDDLTQVLPFNTALLYQIQTHNFDPLLRNQPSTVVAHYEQSVLNWLGNSAGLAIIEPFDTAYRDDCFLVASCIDTALAKQQLLSLAANQQQVAQVQASAYKGFPLFQLAAISNWEQAFGFTSNLLQSPYVTIIDKYVVFGNSMANMKVLLERYLDQQTLDKDLDYRAFKEKMGTDPAIHLYVNTARSQQLLQAIGGAALKGATASANSSFFTLNPIGLQASHLQKDMYLVTGMLQTGRQFQPGTNLLWKAELDTLMAGQPYLVKDHTTGGYELLVQDAAHTLYLIDKAGNNKWALSLDGPIVGPVHQVDYYRNNKLQYLFTTSGAIHLVDRLGRPVENFPLRLPAKVTSGLAVFDYVNNGKYRLFVGCENGQLYGFYKSGQPLPGWSPKKGLGVLPFPIQHHEVGSRDYLVATSANGRIEGFARNGNTRLPARKLNTTFNQPFVLQQDGRRSFSFTNLDVNGVWYTVDNGETLGKDTLLDVVGSAYYAYTDMDGDDIADHIVMDDEYLRILSDTGALIMMYKLPDGVMPGFQVFDIGEEKCIGLTNTTTGFIYAVNASGSLFQDFPLKGFTPFLLTDQLREGEQVVAVGMNDNTLTLYRLQ